MPTDVIDLGYYGIAYMMLPDASDNDGFTTSAAASDAYIRDMHNRIKFQMELENGGNNWAVGRIYKTSTGGSPDYLSYGWVIQHLDGAGSPTGKEFLMVVAGTGQPSTSLIRTSPNQVFEQTPGSSPAEYAGSHFHIADGAESFDGFIGLHYHKGGLTDSYDVGAGNDFDPPNTDPAVDKDTFFPDTTNNLYPRGIMNADYSNSIFQEHRQCLIFNWEKPFVGLYNSRERNHYLRYKFIVGDIFIPRLSTDTYTAGGMFLATTNGGSTAGTGKATRHELMFATFQDDQGNQLNALGEDTGEYGWVFPNRFTLQSQPRADGTYDRERVKVMAKETVGTPVTYDKGYFDPDVLCMIGASNVGIMNLFDSPIGPMIKVGMHLAVPWADGYPVPFSGWPLNPQRKYEP